MESDTSRHKAGILTRVPLKRGEFTPALEFIIKQNMGKYGV